MILFDNGFFHLDYDPATDTVFVKLPDMRTQGLSEAEECFRIMVEHVNNYHVQNLLLDSRQALVEVGDTEYNHLIYRVSLQLKKTNLKKVARLASSLPKLESMAHWVQAQVLTSPPASYLIKNFTSQEAALEWLTGNSLRSDI
ncbi:hypothetical protein [Adhaeribacter radiodurans]|uniref:STAS/SEC14 domain-containing protein n=1 Tax=Adhaeribacter radiodurans TaxID=2745197 RepID=A0A7L7L146_9BACT|nr:hypothetical protein [Adhaeribacter radiodurans]QMU26510.1 hypothetical protein HUW48_00105 [Adhaeribacter radiodurans]